jgi:hypothetical protein
MIKIWAGLLESIPAFVKEIISYAKLVPGVCDLPPKFFASLVNLKVFDVWLIRNMGLFIDDESFLRLPNSIQYSRAWMNRIIGKLMTDTIFAYEKELHDLEMSLRECAIILTYVITLLTKEQAQVFNDECLSQMNMLNEYYYKALLYEFDMNQRDQNFIDRVGQVRYFF